MITNTNIFALSDESLFTGNGLSYSVICEINSGNVVIETSNNDDGVWVVLEKNTKNFLLNGLTFELGKRYRFSTTLASNRLTIL